MAELEPQVAPARRRYSRDFKITMVALAVVSLLVLVGLIHGLGSEGY